MLWVSIALVRIRLSRGIRFRLELSRVSGCGCRLRKRVSVWGGLRIRLPVRALTYHLLSGRLCRVARGLRRSIGAVGCRI